MSLMLVVAGYCVDWCCVICEGSLIVLVRSPFVCFYMSLGDCICYWWCLLVMQVLRVACWCVCCRLLILLGVLD